MDKKNLYWVIGILVVLILLFVMFRGNTEGTDENSVNNNINNAQASQFADIETSDGVFNEIDSALNSLE